MEIIIADKGRKFFSHLHYAITDFNTLYLASMGGIESSVNAITAGIIEGRTASCVIGSNQVYDFNCDSGQYKRLIKMSAQTCHGMVVHKSAVFEEERPNPIIVAQDGNMGKAVGSFLANKFALPKEWVDEYYKLLPSFMVEQLDVYVNLLYPEYSSLRAAKLSVEVTENFILKELDERLKNKRLAIPAKLGAPIGLFDPSWDTKKYLTANAAALAMQLDRMQPRHIPKIGQLDREIALMGRIPFPVQAHVIQGTVNALTAKNGEGSLFCGGEMGSGKSISALGVTHLLHKRSGKKGFKVLMMVPGITIPKWITKEIGETLPWAKTRVLRSHTEALELLKQVRQENYEPDGLEFILVGTDRAKLGPEPWCTAIWKRVAGEKFYAWHCSNCYEPLPAPDPDDDTNNLADILAGWNVLAKGDKPITIRGPKNLNGVPANHNFTHESWNKRSPLKKCPQCNSKLWRTGNKSHVKQSGEARCKPRWFISRILKKLGPWFDLMIADEIHQTKAQDSGRGDAFAQMVKSSKKVLMLTGTLVNGKSTSIKEILWRTDSKSLLKAGFDHKSGMVQWAGRYGTLKRVVTTTETDTGVTVRKKKVELQPTEEPGISPAMTTQFLLHKTSFMELQDLGLPLIEKKEIPVFLDMDPDHLVHYKSFHEALFNHCRQAAQRGSKGAWSRFIPATINYADRPDMGGRVVFGNSIDPSTSPIVITAPQFPQDYYNSKERWLVETVQKELAENRGVIIYNNYTDSYGMNQRIQQVLAAHGIDVTTSDILKSNTSPEDRVEWLAKKEEEGRKVLITNMRLVEVGLDLIAWPTIIFQQLNYDINIVRQSGQRSWRIGQHRECRIYFPVLNETQQMAQFQNLMTKRAHALMVEGRLDRGELSKFGRDAHNAMAADLASCLAGANLANKWQELAAKDTDNRLKIVSEADFKVEVQKSMKSLQEETMRLCGVTEKERQSILSTIQTPVDNLFSAKIINFKSKQREGKAAEQVMIANGTDGQPLNIMNNGQLGLDFNIPIVVVDNKPKSKKAPAVGQLGFDW